MNESIGQMAPKVFDKTCLICGDRASGESHSTYWFCVCIISCLGFHFDAISCESCKSFFRRNATKYEVRVREELIASDQLKDGLTLRACDAFWAVSAKSICITGRIARDVD